jgi:hypothetical protein
LQTFQEASFSTATGFLNIYPSVRKSTEDNFRVADDPEVYAPEMRLIGAGRIHKDYCWSWLA